MNSEERSIPGETWRSALKGITTLVAPTTVVTALLYYFGWARSTEQARSMGMEESLFGYSTSDYILRSMSSLFFPMFVGVALLAIGLTIHAAVINRDWGAQPMPASGRPLAAKLLARFIALVAVAGATLLVIGLVGSRQSAPTRMVVIGSPLFVTLGIGLIGYAVHLRRRIVAGSDSRDRWSTEARSFQLLSATLFPVLLLLGLFWTISKYAAVKGRDLATLIDERQSQFPDVKIYSAKPLQLQPPVIERRVGPPDSAFPYEYTGLKFLFRSDNKYFLRPSGSNVNILIPETLDARFEFSKPSTEIGLR